MEVYLYKKNINHLIFYSILMTNDEFLTLPSLTPPKKKSWSHHSTKRKIEGKIKEKWVQEIKKTVKRISYFFIKNFLKRFMNVCLKPKKNKGEIKYLLT